jgi:hypothetical protein
MRLAAPPASYLFRNDDVEADAATPAPDAAVDAGPAPSTQSLRPTTTPQDTNVSGRIAEPLRTAVAGFVLYRDTNGNGALDLEGSLAGSPDEILGGNTELVLQYFSGGSRLEYEKLRDTNNVLPHAGYNLLWVDKNRWFALDLVELNLTSRALPQPLCSGAGGGDTWNVPDASTHVEDAGPHDPDTTPRIYVTAANVGVLVGVPFSQCSVDGRAAYGTLPCQQGGDGGVTPLCASEIDPWRTCSSPQIFIAADEAVLASPYWPCHDATGDGGPYEDAPYLPVEDGGPAPDGGF